MSSKYSQLYVLIFCLIKHYQSPIYIAEIYSILPYYIAASFDLCSMIHVYNTILNSVRIIMNYLLSTINREKHSEISFV